jgi:hypothetical protein
VDGGLVTTVQLIRIRVVAALVSAFPLSMNCDEMGRGRKGFVQRWTGLEKIDSGDGMKSGLLCIEMEARFFD